MTDELQNNKNRFVVVYEVLIDKSGHVFFSQPYLDI